MEEEKIISSVMRYKEATQVTSHHIMFTENIKSTPCNTNFCEEFKRLTGKSMPCINIKKYYAEQAARLGEYYIYYCPIGLCHWIAPIIFKGKLQGTLYGGPVLITDKLHDLYVYLDDIQQIEPQRVTALAEMLLLVCKSISDAGYTEVADSRGILSRQQEELYQSINRIKENLSISDIKSSIEKEQLLLRAIEDLNSEETKKILNEILVELFAVGGEDTDILITRILELVVILSKGALTGVIKVTPNYLSKIFKESMGKTFTQYLNVVRIESSKKLLVEEELSLEEIAIKSGFTD